MTSGLVGFLLGGAILAGAIAAAFLLGWKAVRGVRLFREANHQGFRGSAADSTKPNSK